MINEKHLKEFKEVIEYVNESYNEFAKLRNVDNHVFEMEFEKVYSKILFTNAKKRYAARMIWKDGKRCDKVIAMGFSTRRSDTPAISRDFEKELFNLILKGEPKERVVKFVNEFKEKIRSVPIEQIAIPIGVSKDFNEYINTPIHIRACELANKRHNANIHANDKVKYVYVKRQPKSVSGSFENVIAFKNKMWDDYIIDYDKMTERLCDNKVNPVFEALRWNEGQNKSLADWF